MESIELDRQIAEMRENPRDAEVIRLRYVDGYSARETAAILRITEEAAQKRAERAKERLKALLIENGFEEYFE